MRNKYLIILLALIVIYLGITFIGGKKERSFDDKITGFNVENVNKIVINPKDKTKKEFSIKKTKDKWDIVVGDESFEADNSTIDNTLSSLKKMKIKNIITKNPDNFAKYELEKDKCKRVKLYDGKDKLVDILVGKFKYNQQSRSANSYVRLADKNEVFSIDGFLSMNISDNISTYRIKTLAKFTIDQLDKITYTHQNLDYHISKQDDKWIYNGVILDSLKMKAYISKLSNLKGAKFMEDVNWQKPESSDKLVLNIENNDNIEITAYPDTIATKAFVINSSLNDKAYFQSDSSGLYKNVFGELQAILDKASN